MHPRALATSLSIGFGTLRANPLRTILSTLGIVIGVASLVAVLSVGDGMERLARNRIMETTSLQRIQVAPRLFRVVDGTSFPQSDPAALEVSDVNALRGLLGDSVAVNLMVTGSALVTAAHDTTPHATLVQGVLERDPGLVDSALAAGRFFTAAEAASGAPVVIISDRLARDYARGGESRAVVGDTLHFLGKAREVIGLLRAAEGDITRRAIMPARAADAVLMGAQGRREQVVVTSPSLEAVAPIRARVERWASGRFGARWKDSVRVATDESRLDQARRGLLLFKLFMGALTGISLIVGGIGIMNVLLSSVSERTREIGIRRATGAAARDILWQFLAESVAITGAGSVVGLVLGVSASFSITAVMRRASSTPIHAWLSVSTVLVAVGASVVVGLAFGLYPARRAARLSPIDAMRHE